VTRRFIEFSCRLKFFFVLEFNECVTKLLPSDAVDDRRFVAEQIEGPLGIADRPAGVPSGRR